MLFLYIHYYYVQLSFIIVTVVYATTHNNMQWIAHQAAYAAVEWPCFDLLGPNNMVVRRYVVNGSRTSDTILPQGSDRASCAISAFDFWMFVCVSGTVILIARGCCLRRLPL